MIREPDVKIGQTVIRVPQTFADYDPQALKKHAAKPMRGRVVYIHPQGRYHTVAFETRGGEILESFLGTSV